MRTVANQSKQLGMAMIISLVMLMLMTIIVVQAARSSNLELLVGNNSQLAAEALMEAEDSAVAGEGLIKARFVGAPVVEFGATADDGLYVVGDVDVHSVDWGQLAAERVGSGHNYREYIVEYLGPVAAVGGSLAVGAGAAGGNRFFLYRVSGRGESSRGGARVVQTIYAVAE